MFPRRYFAGRYFAPRYWPESEGGAPAGGGNTTPRFGFTPSLRTGF